MARHRSTINNRNQPGQNLIEELDCPIALHTLITVCLPNTSARILTEVEEVLTEKKEAGLRQSARQRGVSPGRLSTTTTEKRQ